MGKGEIQLTEKTRRQPSRREGAQENTLTPHHSTSSGRIPEVSMQDPVLMSILWT